MRNFIRVVLLGAVVSAAPFAQAQGMVGGFLAREYVNAAGVRMPYRLFIPRAYDPTMRYPLVVYLHGSSALGNDNQKQISATNSYGPRAWSSPATQSRHPAFVLAPQVPVGAAWSNFVPGEPEKSIKLSLPAQMMLEIVASLEHQYSIDAGRLYLTGQSLGGFGTWDIIAKRPEVFAAAAPMCGAGDPTRAAVIKDLPIWVFHGSADDVVSVLGSREMVAALRKLGSKVKYNEYPGVGHEVWVRAYADPALIEWIFAQRRAP